MHSWLNELFGVNKPVIGMCHLQALPGDPNFDQDAGMEGVIEAARADLNALQTGGVDGVMFSNEFSLPYLTEVPAATTAAMARVIGELYDEIQVVLGVDVLWDPIATVDLAAAVGASFAREIFTGVYASDFGLWNTDYGSVARHRRMLNVENLRLLFNIVPEAAVYLAERDVVSIAKSTVFNTHPDALCVSGLTAGAKTSTQTLGRVKEAVPTTPVFANTGVRLSNVEEQLAAADGAVIGTAFKQDGVFENPVDVDRVRAMMDKVYEIREQID